MFFGLAVQAEEATSIDTQTDAPLLPAAFLEFLGEWEDQQGDWQDPLEFADPHWQSLPEDAEQRDEAD